MNALLDLWRTDRPLRVFVLVLFPLTFAVWLLVWIMGGLAAAPFAPPLTMLLPGVVALAVTRWVARQPVAATLHLRPQLNRGRGWVLLLALVVPALLMAGAAWLSALLLPAAVTPDLAAALHRALAPLHLATGHAALDALVLVVLNNGLGVLLNAPLFLGEEIGWRAFLFPRLARGLGAGRAFLLMGVLWGGWHAGGILQGYNYPQHPVAGVLLFMAICAALSVVFQWFYQRSGSVWGAALAHGALNSAPKTLSFFCDFGPYYYDLLHGYAGLLALLVFGAAAAWYYRRWKVAEAAPATTVSPALAVAQRQAA